MSTIKDLRLAVLIDADNISYSNIKKMLEEIAKYGTPTFKRIYADWTKPNVVGWKSVLLENAITPIQQYAYTTGKNSSDSALIIDAMDILYTGRVDGFCIISSDSDFTRLATRLREAGMKVFGMGEKKTPPAFISACDKFIYLEILKNNEIKEKTSGSSSRLLSGSANGVKSKNQNSQNKPQTKTPTATVGTVNADLIKTISDSINDLAEDDDGYVSLAEVGKFLNKKQPDFDPRNYGFKKLFPLIKSLQQFQIDERNTGKNNTTQVYVRTK